MNNQLDFAMKCDMKRVKYLDITFNLNDSTYQPYQTPDISNRDTSNLITLQISLLKLQKQW